MENEENKKTDCGCSDPNCCTPKKSKLWMKIVFVVILAAAITIVVVKLTSSQSENSSNSAVTTEKSSCSDTTKKCDPQKNPGCCPKSKE